MTPPLPLHNSGAHGVRQRASTFHSLRFLRQTGILETSASSPSSRRDGVSRLRGLPTQHQSHSRLLPVLFCCCFFKVSLLQIAAGKLPRFSVNVGISSPLKVAGHLFYYIVFSFLFLFLKKPCLEQGTRFQHAFAMNSELAFQFFHCLFLCKSRHT